MANKRKYVQVTNLSLTPPYLPLTGEELIITKNPPVKGDLGG
jgi:hypothetical protein